MLTRLYRNGLYLPARLRRGVSALWRETDGGGAFPCCCARGAGSSVVRETITCTMCIGNVAAARWLVSVSGVVDGPGPLICYGGGTCASWDGDYIASVWVGVPCRYRAAFYDRCVIYGAPLQSYVEVLIEDPAGPNLRVSVLLMDVDFVLGYQTTFLASQGCTELSISLPFDSLTGIDRCDGSGAIVTVSSL